MGSAETAVDMDNGRTIILIFHEAFLQNGNENSLLSITQMRERGMTIDEVPKKYGGKQKVSVYGINIRLLLHNARLGFQIRIQTRHKCMGCDRYHMTSDGIWDLEAH